MGRLKIYRRTLIGILFLSIILLGGYGVQAAKKNIPDEIKIIANQEQEFNFKLPIQGEVYKESVQASDMETSSIPEGKLNLNLQKPVTFVAEDTGVYKMACKLFGLIHLKTVSVQVVDEQYLIPGGTSVGIYLETDGVLIIGTGTITGADGLNYEPAYNLVQSGDYIREIDGNKVNNKKELIEYLNKSGGNDVILTIYRNSETIELKLKPVQTGGDEYKLGIWVRDNTQGIGTLTYVDAYNGFGALGHGINDSDTGILMNLKKGELYEAQIMSITKGEKGSPGGLEGVIQYDRKYLLGDINGNTNAGIFGTIQNLSDIDINSTPREICLKQDIQIGAAKILCAVDGTTRSYDIQITDINIAEDNVNKGIVLQVTDSALLDLTGGIVQGMSGSPIIQNDKIVGAVTHVFVQDSTKGYGIFIENMLEYAK